MGKSGRSAATPKKQSQPRVSEGIVRRSVSLDRNVDALAHELVGGANFSAFVNEAVRQKSQQMQMLRLLEDLDEQFGPVGKVATAKANVLWRTASRSTRARS
jgi:hypothetical protein